MQIDLTIHSFSLWHHFEHVPGFDALAFARLAKSYGLSGISLSLNDPNYRHLGGRVRSRMDALRDYLQSEGMSLEVDTSGTDPVHMRELLDVAAHMGADTLRTYTRHRGMPSEMLRATQSDLATIVDHAEQVGVTVVLENHEDFTGPELAQIVEGIDHARLKILYDYGNSQMVLEDPEAALDAVIEHVHSVHVKDHVMVRAEDAGQLTVAGVPIGEGSLPIKHLTQRLLDQGLRRFTFENVWAYSAPIQLGRNAQDGVVLGESSFAFARSPFDPSHLVLDQSKLAGPDLVHFEKRALDRGMAWYKSALVELGCGGSWKE